MRRKLIYFTAALMVSAMAATGCGSTSTTETTSSPETQAETVIEETTDASADSAADAGEDESTTTSEGESVDGADAQNQAETPVRIWGTITDVTDTSITVDSQAEEAVTGEIILQIDPESTYILDAENGLPVAQEELQIGSSFEAYLGPAMTMSLPPQTTPVMVIVNIPEDSSAPQYAVAAEALKESTGGYVLEATDGRSYTITPDAEVTPFLTRNIVTLEDISEGSRCLLWLDENEVVNKLVLFAE